MRQIHIFYNQAINWHDIVPDFWRFTQICKKFAAVACKIVFVIVSEQFYYRSNNKNNFARKCCKFLANLCKSSEILEHCHVQWWIKYRNNRSVSWRLSCTSFYHLQPINILHLNIKWCPNLLGWNKFTLILDKILRFRP